VLLFATVSLPLLDALAAPLARLEARVTLEELLSHFDRVERRTEELSWAPQLIPRGETTLPLRPTRA
jgi:cytochrome P450